jgi:hypothetical protein
MYSPLLLLYSGPFAGVPTGVHSQPEQGSVTSQKPRYGANVLVLMLFAPLIDIYQLFNTRIVTNLPLTPPLP